jgi:NDP-sugar pyrophosphorylase family protein
MEAVVLAGGQGTRLLPYTADLPKALVPICGYPVIEILLGRLRKFGFTKVSLAVNHRADQIESVLGDGTHLGIQIGYSHETEPLSTVGPITLIPNLPDTFLVTNADVLTDLDLGALVRAHRESGCRLTISTCLRSDRMQYGVFKVNQLGQVTEFEEKPTFHFTVSMGVYVFSKSLLALVPPRTRFGFDDLVNLLLAKKEPINTYLHTGFWLDIGRVEDYLRANTRDASRIRHIIEIR